MARLTGKREAKHLHWEKNKRDKQVPTLLWDWMSSCKRPSWSLASGPVGTITQLWDFFIVCFVPYLQVLCSVWDKLDVIKRNRKGGRSP